MLAGLPSMLLACGAALGLAYILLHPPNPAFLAGGALGGTQVVGNDFPKRLIDPLGREHLLPSPPQRIVSAILAGDEMLVDLVPAQRVVGVTYLVDDAGISNVAGHYPEAIPRVRADVEELLALRPDLVLVSAHSNASAVRLLLNAGVAVVRFSGFDSFGEVARNLRTLGKALGEEVGARNAIERMNRRLAAVRRRVADLPRPRVLFYSPSGSIGGAGTLIDEMIELAGGYNLIRETGISGYRRVTPELAIALQPEFVIVSDWSNRGGSLTAELLLNNPAWQHVPAVRNGKILVLRGAWATSGSQFRVTGVEALARLLHPEAFDALAP